MAIKGLELIRKAGYSYNDYVILGGVASMLHGMKKENNADLDILIRKNLPLKNIGIMDTGHDVLEGEMSAEKIFKNSVIINNYRVMSIEDLKVFSGKLYKKTKKEKHRITLMWLIKNRI